MTTVSHGKPYAGNPHVRIEEGYSASAELRRESQLHKTIVRCFLTFATGVFALGAFSADVTPDMARAAAESWLGENPGLAQGAHAFGQDPRAEVDANGTLIWYEVGTTSGGCVITSPDTSLDPVISYVEKWSGRLSENHPLRLMLEADLQNRLAVIRSRSVPAKGRFLSASVATNGISSPETMTLEQSMTRNQSRWSRLSGVKKSHLLGAAATAGAEPDFVISHLGEWKEDRLTHWNQNNWNVFGYWENCYDKYTPNHYCCGCVATAGATLLQYFNLTKAPSVTRTCKVDGVNRNLTTKGGTYDWSSMPVVWSDSQHLTDAQIDLMGRACYDVGVCIEMSYKESGSGASIYDLAQSLRQDFGLSSAKYRNVTAADFPAQIYAQTRAGMPVVLSIQRTGGGHAVLAVGYGEDAVGSAYTRVFMGWGGQSDAWYALPNIEEYTAVSAVVNELGNDAAVVALCGRVRDGTGNPVPFAEVSYDSGAVFRADANGFWAGRVEMDSKSHKLTCRGVEKSVGVQTSATNIDFTVADEMTVYTDAEAARTAAIREGKALFLLHGATWCQYCSKLKGYIADYGRAFTENFIYLWDDHDQDRYGLGAAGASLPHWAVFDPRTFDIGKGLADYAAKLYERKGCPTEYSYFVSYLASALDKWNKTNAACVSADLGSSDAISTLTTLSAAVCYADGTVADVTEGVEWKIVCGDAALLADGALNPLAGKTGGVLLMGEVWVQGEKRTFFHRVSVLNGVSVIGVEITGPSSIDLYDVASGSYKALARFSDGSSGTLPAVWSLEASDELRAQISDSGVLSFASYSFEGTKNVRVNVKCSGFTSYKDVAVIEPGGIVSFGGYFDKNVVWPGSTLKFMPTAIKWRRHGIDEDPTASVDGIDFSWYVYTNNYRAASGNGLTATLPSKIPQNLSRLTVAIYAYPESDRYSSGCYGYASASPSRVTSQPSFVTVSFDTDGNGALEPMKCMPGGTYMRLPALSKKGYQSSWYDASGNQVTTSSTVPSSTVTLHHAFAPIAYYINYDANGGEGIMSYQYAYYDTPLSLRPNAYAKMGFAFRGWSLTPGGPVMFADGDAILNLTDIAYKDVYLYAAWEEVAVSAFELTGAEAILSATKLEASLVFEDGSVWALDEGVTWTVSSGNAASVSADGTLSPMPGRTGVVTVSANVSYRGTTYRVQKNVRVVSQSQIQSLWIEGEGTWIPRTTYESRKYQLVARVGAEELLLSADAWNVTWSNRYGDSFDDNYALSQDGTIDMLYGGEVGSGTLTARIGSLTAELAFETYATPRVLWQPKPSSLVLYPGADVRLDDVFTIVLADGTVCKTCGFEGLQLYNFYFTDSTLSTTVKLFDDSSKPTLVNGNVLHVPETAACASTDGYVYLRMLAEALGSSQFCYLSGNVKFTWCNSRPSLVDVTFDPMGGTLEGGTESVVRSYAGTKAYGSLPIPVRPGYSFAGWHTAASGGTKVEETTAVKNVAHRLYAHWTSTTMYVYLLVNGGTGANKAQTFTVSDLADGTLPANTYTRSGYVFDGWSTSSGVSVSARKYADRAKLSSLDFSTYGTYIYLYAVWRPVSVTTIPVVGTDVSVPKAWLDAHSGIVSRAGNDYVRATTLTAANGRSVWECYVAGLDPEDPNDDFVLDIEVQDGKPVINYDRKSRRAYVEEGCTSLTSGDWHRRQEGDRFFRVRVTLP